MPAGSALQQSASDGLETYWSVPIDELLAGLRARPAGLSSADAATRLKEAHASASATVSASQRA